jgi:hypothetical protein
VISEFISLSPGLPLVPSILDEAALPVTKAGHGYERHGGISTELLSQQFARRALLETQLNKEKRK